MSAAGRLAPEGDIGVELEIGGMTCAAVSKRS